MDEELEALVRGVLDGMMNQHHRRAVASGESWVVGGYALFSRDSGDVYAWMLDVRRK